MLPDAFLARMRRLLGREFDAFLASYELPRNLGIRLNPLKQACKLPCCLERVRWEPNGYYCAAGARPGLSAYHDAGVD